MSILASRTDLVNAEMRAMIAAEGDSHVSGRYVRDVLLADRLRRQVAEQRVDAAERRRRYLAQQPCPMCRQPVTPDQPADECGLRLVHRGACTDELNALLSGAAETADAMATEYATV